jgi:hypothetical protein
MSENPRERFESHDLNDDQKRRSKEVRVRFQELVDFLVDELEEGRELSLVLTKLEEASFWAQASIAREDWGERKLQAQMAGQVSMPVTNFVLESLEYWDHRYD